MADDGEEQGRVRLSKAEYEERARERMRREDEEMTRQHEARLAGTVVVRDHLKPREKQVDLKAHINTYSVITSNTPLAKRGGFYCETCDCLLRDSHTYLDHVNGKKHQRALGMSMKIKHSTLDDVRSRLDKHKRGLIQSRSQVEGADTRDVEDRLRSYEEEERKKKRRRKEEKRRRKEEKQRAAEEAAAEAYVVGGGAAAAAKAAAAGESSSSSSGGNAASASSSSSSSSSAAVPTDTSSAEDAMMAAMGFASFGGGKKT